MNFEWDKQKNELNITKHGFDFADAYRIFDLPMAIDLDNRSNYYGEERWIGTGMLYGRVVVVVYVVYTEIGEATIRIISLRKALAYERKRYEQYLKNRLV